MKTAIITNNETYILTGATGFLGSHIMSGLLQSGKSVIILGRPANGETLKERIAKLLKWFDIYNLENNLEYYETDFTKPDMGLNADDYAAICKRGLSIIHCASDTSFIEKNREKIMAANVESLAEILNIAERSNTLGLHYVSSAYAAGTENNECGETRVTSKVFTNVYEESKAQAEKIITERCSLRQIPYTILRPSIVYGDSETGKSLRFNALYYPVKSLQKIRDIYLEDIKTNNGKKSAEIGISIQENGTLRLPVRINIAREGNINLVPVNYFVDTLLAIIENPQSGAYYNITSGSAVTMKTLAAYTERFLKITGITVEIGAAASEAKNPPEELFDHYISVYRPYISDQRIFIRKNTDSITHNAPTPELTYEVFERCMTYAVNSDWGKKLGQIKRPLNPLKGT